MEDNIKPNLKIPNFISGHQKGTRPCFYPNRFSNSNLFGRNYFTPSHFLLSYTTCTSVYTPHMNGTHTWTLHKIYIDSCKDILYYCTQLDCTSVYTTSVQVDNTFTHLRCTHFAWISCTAEHLYCSQVTVRLYCKLVLTNDSPTNITIVNQSQLRFLGIPSPPPPA
jgi:hypothetical protein